MGTKNNPSEFDCWANLEPDEPFFVLMGRDAAAGNLVRQWAYLRKKQIELGYKPAADAEQIDDAVRCAEAMEAWFKQRKGKLRA